MLGDSVRIIREDDMMTLPLPHTLNIRESIKP